MASQLDIFGGAGGGRKSSADLPEGFRYKPELIGAADEAALLARVRELPFREFEFHGYTGKRRTISFGWHYDFSGRQLRKAEDIPDFLLALRPAAAAFGGMEPKEELSEREEEVLRLVARGYSNKEIAARLSVSVKTVEAHKANGMGKLGLAGRSDIVNYAIFRGWMKND